MYIINFILMKHPEVSISKLLIKKGRTIAIAESCTGGLLTNLLTNISGSSRYLLLGIVAYSNQSKTSLLKIPALLIKRHGAVSSHISQLMAKKVRAIASSDYGIGITGVAGPLGGTPTKPIGTVFISIATRGKVVTKKFNFSGNRLMVKRKTVLKAISLLRKLIR